MVADMQTRLDKVLHKVYNPQAQDIVKGLRKDAGLQDNIVAKRQEMSITHVIDHNNNSQNIDPNRGDTSQQSIWAEELRRADERAGKFRVELAESERRRQELQEQIRDMERRMGARDQEITRLGQLYRGGQNFD